MKYPVKIYDYDEKKVLTLDINDVIALIAASGMPFTFPDEAIKAQIIIARTFIARKLKYLGGNGCSRNNTADICNSSHCINFLSKEELKEKWRNNYNKNWTHLMELLEETQDKIIVVNNKPILPHFHEACGGATENSENINGTPISYLRKTFCNYCKENIEDITNSDTNIKEIEQTLDTSTTMLYWENHPEIKGFIENIEQDEEGRIKSLKIGNKVFKGHEIIDYLGIQSTRFGWAPKVITFQSKGCGDGLGLCQYGAKMMAKEGKTAEDILRYYYTGIDITGIKPYDPSKPLEGRTILLDPGNGAKKDNGYCGRDLMLQICNEIKEQLLSWGAKVCLTREIDKFCSLQEKSKFSNTINPDFYIAINCNYANNKSLSGTDIFHFRGDQESKSLAESISKRLNEQTDLIQKGVKIADLSIFKEIRVNALLIELGYLSNEQDQSVLENCNGKKCICKLISEAIHEFYTGR